VRKRGRRKEEEKGERRKRKEEEEGERRNLE
jgi:hypothetical protein